MSATRPTIFLELTQAEAHALDAVLRHNTEVFGTGTKSVRSVEAKLHEAMTDEDVRSALMEDAIIEDDYDPAALPGDPEPTP